MFYETLLGRKITAMTTHADTPAAEDWCGKILHARLEVGGTC